MDNNSVMQNNAFWQEATKVSFPYISNLVQMDSKLGWFQSNYVVVLDTYKDTVFRPHNHHMTTFNLLDPISFLIQNLSCHWSLRLPWPLNYTLILYAKWNVNNSSVFCMCDMIMYISDQTTRHKKKTMDTLPLVLHFSFELPATQKNHATRNKGQTQTTLSLFCSSVAK
jgi:hypothetical protein